MVSAQTLVITGNIQDGIVGESTVREIVQAARNVHERSLAFHVPTDEVAQVFAWRGINATFAGTAVDEVPQFICEG